MTYAYPVRELAAESHLLKLQRLQNRVLRTFGNFPKPTSVGDMHEAFQIPYVYDYITNSYRQQAKSSKIMKIKMSDTENIRGLNLAVVMCTTVQVSKLPW
jgi:hypothetical protein